MTVPPTSFKVCPRRGTSLYSYFTGGGKKVLFETECLYVEAGFGDFKEWLERNQENSARESSDGEPPDM